MDTKLTELTFYITEINPVDFYGVNNANIELIRERFKDIKFIARGSTLRLLGTEDELRRVNEVIKNILKDTKRYGRLDKARLTKILSGSMNTEVHEHNTDQNTVMRDATGKSIIPRNDKQDKLIKDARTNDILFAIGPAGTGKTFIAVALAVKALKEKRVKKIVLVRPAVEAGESLGFLPGDLKEKIDPYLRPLYDSLEALMSAESLKRYLEKDVVEIVPLAYMRGRTLSSSFIILDEAQNATEMQMKMFLTRLGEDSHIIITGDPTQIDLPPKLRSGLLHATRILKGIAGISFVEFTEKDVVRHPIVQNILLAYDKEKQEKKVEGTE